MVFTYNKFGLFEIVQIFLLFVTFSALKSTLKFIFSRFDTQNIFIGTQALNKNPFFFSPFSPSYGITTSLRQTNNTETHKNIQEIYNIQITSISITFHPLYIHSIPHHTPTLQTAQK